MDFVYYNENKAEIYAKLKDLIKHCQITKTNKKIEYYEISASFDIETSSFYRKHGKQYAIDDVLYLSEKDKKKYEKVAIMYVWQFAMQKAFASSDDYIYISGRTWLEFDELLTFIQDEFRLNENRRLVIYVHNLQYEFQFMRKLWDWNQIFADEERKPIYALFNGIEFRCSYRLSDYSLKKLAENLISHEIEKLTGNLDYNQIRHANTPLTQKEQDYNKNDVIIVIYYIQEMIAQYGTITQIPLTKTGKVRKFIKNKIASFGKDRSRNYYNLISSITYSLEEYTLLMKIFQGGFTHASSLHVRETLENVYSEDETSAYPYYLVSKKFPLTKGRKIKIEDKKQFLHMIKYFACIFEIRLFNVKPKITYENYLSSSKCLCKNAIINNGRIVSADEISTAITEIDFEIINMYYTYDSFQIGTFYYYGKYYLPLELVEGILDLYENKTKLKGVKGKETEYMNSKEMLNSVFGMCCTNVIRDEISYDGEKWGKIETDKERDIIKYNTSKNRFLAYIWGVYDTAYNRLRQAKAIIELGEDYCYTDTDSVKFLNYEKHIEYFKKDNEQVKNELIRISEERGIDFKRFEPTTIKGEKKLIGAWDFDGLYTRFKTLGAKRYMVVEDGETEITISGVNKKVATPYLLEKYGDDVFDMFDDELYIPPNYSGKLLHTYIDDVKTGKVIDYLGNSYNFIESSSIHLEPTGYDLSLDSAFIDFLFNIKRKIALE